MHKIQHCLGLFSGLNIIKGRIKRDYKIIIINHLAGKCICEEFSTGHYVHGGLLLGLIKLMMSFCVKSPNFQEIPHDTSQMFPKKLLKIPQCDLMTQTKKLMLIIIRFSVIGI